MSYTTIPASMLKVMPKSTIIKAIFADVTLTSGLKVKCRVDLKCTSGWFTVYPLSYMPSPPLDGWFFCNAQDISNVRFFVDVEKWL